MNKTLINGLLFAVAFAVVWLFAYPLYASTEGILSILNRKSVQDYKMENIELKSALVTATELGKSGSENVAAYNSLDPNIKNRIGMAIASTVDIPRTLNDISALADQSGMIISDMRFSKTGNAKEKVANISSYEIGFNVKGNYSSFKSLIASIENSLQIYTIKNISFSGETDQTGPAKTTKYSVVLELYELKK